MKKKVLRKKTTWVSHNPKVTSFVIVGLLVVAIGITVDQAVTSQNNRSLAAGDCTVTSAQMAIKTSEQTLFDNINNYRVQKGLNKLTWNEPLKRAAAWMSHDMFTTKSVTPADSLGRTPALRFIDCGVPSQSQIGESIINGADSAGEIFSGLKIDPQDSDIMLNPNFTLGAVAEEVDTTAGSGFWTFTAASSATGGVNPTTMQPSTVPSTTVPSPACLGGTCPSVEPSIGNPQPSAVVPSESIAPSTSVEPSQAVTPGISGSVVPSQSITPGPGGNNGGGRQGGFIGLFLAFLALILQFFLQLFGR
jgi:uncharacterized protein YkwD